MDAVGWVALLTCVVVVLLLCCAVRLGFVVFVWDLLISVTFLLILWVASLSLWRSFGL